MSPTQLAASIDLDPLAAARGLATRPGTLLLHDQTVRGVSVLYFAPRWTCWFGPDLRPRWSGDVPSAAPPPVDPLRWPLEVARAWEHRPRPHPVGGLAGWLGFDLGPAVWNARHPAAPPFDLPEAWLGAYDLALVFGPDRPAQLVATDLAPWVASGPPLADRWSEGHDLLVTAISARNAPAGRTRDVRFFDRQWHARAVDMIRRHLRDGDAYQVNLTGFATATTSVDPWRAFLHQARFNPVPLAAFVNTGRAVVTSHSPERLLSVRGNVCVTSPIKGTAPARDGDLRGLLASEKERAEHVMIVDLCRNDLGRVCEYGSVRPREFMTELRLEGLVHLVSHIEGRLREADRTELLASLFPGGSVTGAPKRRALEIISQAEATRRGPYTGSVGYVDRCGSADWNIAIRTAVWQNGGVAFGCGGGIVLDSDPDHEYAEARLKASSFFRTLRELSQPEPLVARAGDE